MPSNKRLLLGLGFLDGVKPRLDPSPFLCPAGIVVVAWRFRGYKKGEGCQAFCLGVLFGFIRLIFPLKKLVFSGEEKKLHDLLQSAEFDTSLFAGY
jgi:hypothetical protein